MKVSEYIEALQALYIIHGDVEVVDEMDCPSSPPEVDEGDPDTDTPVAIVLTFHSGS